MTAEELRAGQSSVKERYRAHPESALKTLRATARIDIPQILCFVDTKGVSPVPAGIHPAAGGAEGTVCAGDMLLQSLLACAGVTLCAVATAMRLPVSGGEMTAEGDLDFRGTLGVSREAPVGFIAIRVTARLVGTIDPASLPKLIELTERYCVVARSLSSPITIAIETTG